MLLLVAAASARISQTLLCSRLNAANSFGQGSQWQTAYAECFKSSKFPIYGEQMRDAAFQQAVPHDNF
eukprot:6200900-Pleurochrysis_carterae.AAC.2